MHLIMFDIDGTLVDSNHFDDRLFAESVREVLDIHIDGNWEQFTHATDSGILDQIIDEHNLQPSRPDIHSKVKKHFIQQTKNHLSHHKLEEIPGAVRLIDTLRARANVVLAIATGGWEETAKMKLSAADINYEGIAFASCSDAIARTEIMLIAEQRALNETVPTKRIYFGDGTWDKKACEHLGYEFIAVGKNVEHENRVSDYKNPDLLLPELK